MSSVDFITQQSKGGNNKEYDRMCNEDGEWPQCPREMETIRIIWTAPRVTTRTMEGAVTLTTKTCTATVIVSLLQSPP